ESGGRERSWRADRAAFVWQVLRPGGYSPGLCAVRTGAAGQAERATRPLGGERTGPSTRSACAGGLTGGGPRTAGRATACAGPTPGVPARPSWTAAARGHG